MSGSDGHTVGYCPSLVCSQVNLYPAFSGGENHHIPFLGSSSKDPSVPNLSVLTILKQEGGYEEVLGLKNVIIVVDGSQFGFLKCIACSKASLQNLYFLP